MDAQRVARVLAGTFDANPQVRNPAEQTLSELERTTGYLPMLLQIITINELDAMIRQAAILRLKNIIKDSWSVRKGKTNKIPEADRLVVQQNMLEAVIFQTLPQVRLQLLECMYFMLSGSEFPESWPDLMPKIMDNFKSNDPARIHGALSALSMVFKKFRFKKGTERGALVDSTFPVIEELMSAVVQQTTPRAFDLQRLCIKIFFSSMELSVPTHLTSQQVLGAWVTLFMKVLENQMPADTPNMAQSPLWKAKRWVMNILFRLFNRFGRPKFAEDHEKPFATMFFNNFLPLCLENCVKLLRSKKEGGFVSQKVLYSCYNFIEQSINFHQCYKLIKPVRHFIMLESIFPTLCLNQQDLELWQEDPHEFVRKTHDVMEEWQDPRVSATNLLITMVKVRTKSCLDMVLAAIMQIVQFYEQAPPAEKNHIHKDAALRMFGSLKGMLMATKSYHDPIESMLVKYVFPEFQNQTGFLRSRAAWVVGRFSSLEFKNPSMKPQSVSLVIQALQDVSLPVKLEAAMCLSRMVRDEKVVEHIKPMFPMLLDQFFLLVDEIGSEEVITTLSTLMEHFGEDIAPYATKVCERLVNLLLRLLQADEEDDEAAQTASQCVLAINTILYGLEGVPELYPQLEQLCMPLLVELMKDTSMEFMDNTLEMINCFTYFSKQISPFMWALLPKIVEAYHSFAADYIREMISPIDNYISRGTDMFCGSNNPDYLQIVLSMVTKAYTDPNLVMEAKWSCKLLDTILANCRGKVDRVLPGIVEMAGKKLFELLAQPQPNVSFVLLLLDTLGGASYYNPVLFLQIVQQFGPEFEKNLFNYWLSYLGKMNETGALKHQKMAVLGLSSLALIPVANLPSQLQAAFPEVLVQVLAVLASLKVSEDEYDEGDEEEDEDDEELEDEEILDLGEEQDLDEDEGGFKNVAEYSAAMKENLANYLEGNVEGEDYDSPLDAVDPFVFFCSCLQEMSGRDSQFFQQWTGSLPPEAQSTLQLVMADATKRKQEQEQKAAKA